MLSAQVARQSPAALCRLAAAAWPLLRRYGTDEAAAAVERTVVVDTLGMAKKLESVGLQRQDSEALTRYITEHIILDRNRLSEKFVAQNDMQRMMLEQENRISSFKAELLMKQDMHLATLHKDLERQQNYLDKMKAEIRHEIDKLTASQRLDLNLEKGRMRDELQQLQNKSTEMEIKMDREINELKAMVEKSKNDVIKSVIAIMGTFSAITFTISRVLTM